MQGEFNVLFLCNDNSARSIMAEALLNNKSQGRFRAHSAGERPAEAPRRETLAELEAAGISVDGLRSKHWSEFSQGGGAPHMDFVVMLCDRSRDEPCLTDARPGMGPVTAQWDIPDPAALTGAAHEVARAFHDVFTLLDRRINLLLALQESELKQIATEQEKAEAA